MKLILKYLVNNLKMKKVRTILIISFLIFTNFLILVNLSINDYYQKAYEQNVIYEKGNIDLTVSPTDGNIGFFEDDVELSQAFISDYFGVSIGRAIVSSDGEKIKVNLVGADSSEVNQAGLIRGLREEKTVDYTVISTNTSKILGKQKGDKIIVQILGKDYTYIISDVVENSGVFANDDNHAISILVPQKKVQEHFYGNTDISNIFYVTLNPEANIEDAIAIIKDENGANIAVESSYDKASYEQEKSATSLALMVTVIIMLFISIYLISFIVKVIMLERMQVMGTFQSIGATPLLTSLLFIGENILYGIFGAIGGALVAYVVAPYVFNVLNIFQYSGDIRIAIQVQYYILTLLCSVGIMILCSLSSVWKMRRKTVKELLFFTNKEANNISVWKIIAGVGFAIGATILYGMNRNYNLILGSLTFIFAIIASILLLSFVIFLFSKIYNKTLVNISSKPFTFGVNNTSRDKLLISNITLIATIISLLLCIVMVITSVKHSMSAMINNNDFDISLSTLSTDLSNYNELSTIAGVEDIYYDYIHFGKSEVNTNKNVNVSLLSAKDELSFYNFRSQGISYDNEVLRELLNSEKRVVMVDSFWAERNNAVIGDVIKFTNDKMVTIDSEYEIIGFINSSGFVTTRDAAIISHKYFAKDIGIAPYQILVRTSPDYLVDDVAKNIANVFIETSTSVKTLTTIVDESMVGVESLTIILYVIIGISVILILIGVINNITVNFLNRRYEIAVLYSTSMSRRQLAVMFYGETFFTFIIVAIYAFLLSYLYQFIIPRILWSAGLAFEIQYPFNAIFVTMIVLFVLLNLLVLIPIINLYKMKVIDVLKQE